MKSEFGLGSISTTFLPFICKIKILILSCYSLIFFHLIFSVAYYERRLFVLLFCFFQFFFLSCTHWICCSGQDVKVTVKQSSIKIPRLGLFFFLLHSDIQVEAGRCCVFQCECLDFSGPPSSHSENVLRTTQEPEICISAVGVMVLGGTVMATVKGNQSWKESTAGNGNWREVTLEPGAVVHACNSNSREAEAGGWLESGVLGCSVLCDHQVAIEG